MLNSNNGARLECGAVHKDGIELNFAVAIEVRSDSGIEYGFIFEFDDRFFARLDCRTASFKNCPAAVQRAMDPGSTGLFEFCWNVPGSAMNNQRDRTHIFKYND